LGRAFKRSKWSGLIGVFVVAGITVRRKGCLTYRLCDLWLAERLAERR
jgi:hypothetical protein